MWARAAVRGAVAGLAGVAVMTAGEQVEQRFTGRPDSYVPARTLTALTTGRRLPESARPPVRNHLMHWGTGAAVGALRGIWSAAGLRGVRASLWHTGVRLAVDQTLENVTGVGSPPWTWSRQDQLVDVGHKAVYSLATGVVADRLVAPARDRRGSRGLWD
jgi:hypothetical protein